MFEYDIIIMYSHIAMRGFGSPDRGKMLEYFATEDMDTPFLRDDKGRYISLKEMIARAEGNTKFGRMVRDAIHGLMNQDMQQKGNRRLPQ